MYKKIFTHKKNSVRLFPLGGIGGVTKNLFVYEYWKGKTLQDILLVDCGIGFPDNDMHGVDIIIPDVTYLQDKQRHIRGLLLTHGHDDHIGALGYVLPKLKKIPIYATKLTAGFAGSRMKEFALTQKISVTRTKRQINLGAFKATFVHVTHSIPDSTNIIIDTPIGSFYHGSDFKFDFTPQDGIPSELGEIARAGEKGILCLLSDCLGSERSGYTISEKLIEETIEKELLECNGKFLFATQSSNISRIQQAINVAVKHKRKVAFIGRSMDKNSEVARKLGFLTIPEQSMIKDKKILRQKDNDLFLIVAGSQGQAESGLSRISRREHRFVTIRDGDVVMISSDPIPGNETAVNQLIDTLIQAGARVSHSGVVDDVHVSGHGSKQDLRLMLSLTKPKYILPIGGTYRHMISYSVLAQEMGYKKEAVLLPREGEILEFSKKELPKVVDTVKTKQIMVDGLGIGDVGEVVLRDRRTLATEGIVVIVIPLLLSSGEVVGDIDIISRGFIYMKESGQIVHEIKKLVTQKLKDTSKKKFDWHIVRRDIEKTITKFLYKQTGRKPLVVPVVVEV